MRKPEPPQNRRIIEGKDPPKPHEEESVDRSTRGRVDPFWFIINKSVALPLLVSCSGWATDFYVWTLKKMLRYDSSG